jgi:hypothetical protein
MPSIPRKHLGTQMDHSRAGMWKSQEPKVRGEVAPWGLGGYPLNGYIIFFGMQLRYRKNE